MLQDIENHSKQMKYFLFGKELHGLADGEAKRSANEAAFALAKASNQLHWHENHCSTCKQATRNVVQNDPAKHVR
jgi:hypothetical protein